MINGIYKLRDGDKDPKVKQAVTNHYVWLAERANKIANSGKNVCISFIAPLYWCRDVVRQTCPDVLLVKINVEVPILVEKNFKRMVYAHEEQGMTLADAWQLDDEETVKLRKRYGEVYSDEIYKQWLKDEWYSSYDEV